MEEVYNFFIKMKKEYNNKKSAIIHTLSLILSIFAFAYILGSSIGFVSATETTAYCNDLSIGNIENSCLSEWDSYRDGLFDPGVEITCPYIWNYFKDIYSSDIISTNEYPWVTGAPPEGEEINGVAGAYCNNEVYGIINAGLSHQAWVGIKSQLAVGGESNLPYSSNNCQDIWADFMRSETQCVPYETNIISKSCGGTDYFFTVESIEQEFALDKWGCISNYIGEGFTQDCTQADNWFRNNWERDEIYGLATTKCNFLTDVDLGYPGYNPGDAVGDTALDKTSDLEEVADGTQEISGEEGTWGEKVEEVITTAATDKVNQEINKKVGNVTDTLWGKAKNFLFGEGETKEVGAGAFSKTMDFIFKSTPGVEKSAWHTLGRFAVHAGVAVVISYAVTQVLLQVPGIDPRNAQAAGWAIGGGYFLAQGLATSGVIGPGILGPALGLGPVGWVWIGLSVAIFAFLYKDYETNLVSFSCNAWQAPSGGEYCELCNDYGILGCTEYQCKSLGRDCILTNVGDPEFQACVANDPTDIARPSVTAWEEILDTDYKYIEETSQLPGDYGVRLIYENSIDGCSPAFHQLKLGVKLDKFGRCKMDPIRQENYEDLRFGFGGGLVDKYNHSQTFSFPGTANLEQNGYSVHNGGEYNFYVQCESTNGISSGNFVFSFCINKEDDNSAPRIYGSSPANQSHIPFNTSEIEVELYIDEPSQCRWDRSEKPYDEMLNEIPLSSCADLNHSEINIGKTTYPCTTTLTGIQDNADNNFYFKCMDQPELIGTENEGKRNVMGLYYTYVLSLQGTKPLALTTVGPQDRTITASNSPVKVEFTATTEEGAENGIATCQYSPTGDWGDYISFDPLRTNSRTHSTDVWLPSGEYHYYIQCHDVGGNFDTKTINFTVDVDESYSIIVRAYKDNNYLKIITNEEAECRFSTDPRPESACTYSFDDGTLMNNIGKTQHFTAWDSDKNFYIKCKDSYGNLPDYDQCSVVIRPFDLA